MVKASRKLVCIRPNTYENPEESKVLDDLYLKHNGDRVNTVFAVFEPDGETALLRPARAPRQHFGSPEEFAAYLERVAARYPAKPPTHKGLPKQPDVRVALNVAACDDRPLVILLGDSATLRRQLTDAAWSPEHVGRQIYVEGKAAELKAIQGVTIKRGLVVVQPDSFGLEGKVLAQAESFSDARALGRWLSKAREGFTGDPFSVRQTLRQGRSRGIQWEAKLPQQR